MKEPICITGMGIVSAIGLNQQEVLRSIQSHRTGIAPMKYLESEHTELPVGEVKLSNERMKSMLGISVETPFSRTSLIGILALKEALDESNIVPSEILRIGFISGTTVGGMDLTERHYLELFENNRFDSVIKNHDCGACTTAIADYFGGFSFVTSISTACSSAANAFILGSELIESGELDIVVVGGCEALTKYHLNGFNTLMILDTEQCRPFDGARRGLNLGEGAAYLVLEGKKSVERRHARAIGILSGYGNACDAFHQTASSADGEGAFLAMNQALRMAELKREDIQYINAHGTGTPNNDASESAAMMRLFGKQLPPVSSTKSFTGHTTSASGSIEAAICLLAMQRQFLPVNLNWTQPMPDGILPNMNDVPDGEIRHVLCNSFGFGGNDTSLLLSKSNDE
jgi:3-oxoacyl-[acyl-carrier-protein] synthase-1